MFIGKIPQELSKFGKSACAVVINSMTTPVIPNEENFAHINVQERAMLKKKRGYVNIAEKLLQLIHRLPLFVVHGNVVLQDRILKRGLLVQRFLGNASNAAKSFGESHLTLNVLAVNIVPKSANILHTLYLRINLMVILFTQALIGKNSAKKSWNEMGLNAKVVDLMATVCMFIMSKFDGMVEMTKKIILFLCAILATDNCTQS